MNENEWVWVEHLRFSVATLIGALDASGPPGPPWLPGAAAFACILITYFERLVSFSSFLSSSTMKMASNRDKIVD